MNTHRSDLADDIVQEALPQHTAPRRDDFKPWHKARKQYIRERQWNELTARMVSRYLESQLQTVGADWSLDEEEGSTGEGRGEIPESVRLGRPLRCLMIPGDDLLDLRSLWKRLRTQKCYIRYLGFNESHGSDQRGTRVHVANNEVTSLESVLHDSRVLADRFQAIASQNSQAYRYLKEYGPYHVVNLDLCDSLFPTTHEGLVEYLTAIHRLADYQMRNQTTPWLLFVTTQVEPRVASAPELRKLCRPTRANWDRHPDFAARLAELLPAAAFQAPDESIEISALTEKDMVRVFGVALGKWLMDLAASASPNWIVQMLPSHRYSIKRQPRVDMLSLAFQFRRKYLPPEDSTGLSNVRNTPQPFPSELECAMRLVKAVESISDVDDILREDGDLRALMENASADLLETAGYDRRSYMAWLRSGEGVSQGSTND